MGTTVELTRLLPSPLNPRKVTTPDPALIESIRQTGILIPLVCREAEGAEGELEVLDGNRRLAALKLIHAEGNPSIPVHIVNFDNKSAVAFMLAANTLREDLSPFDYYTSLYNLTAGFSEADKEQIAQALGTTLGQVVLAGKVMKLPKVWFSALKSGQIDRPVASWLAMLPKEQLVELAKVVELPLTEKDIPDLLDRIKRMGISLSNVPWQITDKKPGCSTCPSYSVNNPDLFGANLKPLCLDPSCFEKAREAAVMSLVQECNALMTRENLKPAGIVMEGTASFFVPHWNNHQKRLPIIYHWHPLSNDIVPTKTVILLFAKIEKGRIVVTHKEVALEWKLKKDKKESAEPSKEELKRKETERAERKKKELTRYRGLTIVKLILTRLFEDRAGAAERWWHFYKVSKSHHRIPHDYLMAYIKWVDPASYYACRNEIDATESWMKKNVPSDAYELMLSTLLPLVEWNWGGDMKALEAMAKALEIDVPPMKEFPELVKQNHTILLKHKPKKEKS